MYASGITIMSIVTATYKAEEAPQCCACLDNNDVLTLLQCNHFIHLECASKMFNRGCPMCRCDMSDLPRDVKRSIRSNIKAHRKEIEEEDLQSAIQMIETEMSNTTYVNTWMILDDIDAIIEICIPRLRQHH